MSDYDGDGRYAGEWQTYSAEDGTYYVDIEATPMEIKANKKNAARIEVAADTVGPLISNVSVSPLLAHPGSEITIYANISDPFGVTTVIAKNVDIIAFDVRGNEAEVDNAVYFLWNRTREKSFSSDVSLLSTRRMQQLLLS
jgi:hypothetical protein